jgi:hypothetical protein
MCILCILPSNADIPKYWESVKPWIYYTNVMAIVRTGFWEGSFSQIHPGVVYRMKTDMYVSVNNNNNNNIFYQFYRYIVKILSRLIKIVLVDDSTRATSSLRKIFQNGHLETPERMTILRGILERESRRRLLTSCPVKNYLKVWWLRRYVRICQCVSNLKSTKLWTKLYERTLFQQTWRNHEISIFVCTCL